MNKYTYLSAIAALVACFSGTASADSLEDYRAGQKAQEAGDHKEALKRYSKSAELGFTSAQYELGKMYFNGMGVAQDYKQAHTWFLKAAEKGDADAQNSLGVLYQEGRGVTENIKDAIAWYKKAAGQGNAKAQTNLAKIYVAGKDVPKDLVQAIELYKKAAEQDYAPAQLSLGLCYASGIGVTQDIIESYKWLTLGSRLDPAGISSLLAMVEKGLPAAEIQEAKNRATAWRVQFDNSHKTLDASKSKPGSVSK